MQNWRIAMIAVALAASFGASVLSAQAHHGWRWAENENSEITGTIKSKNLVIRTVPSFSM